MSKPHTCPTCKRPLVCPVCDAGRQQRITHAQWDDIRGFWNTHVKEPVKRLTRITEGRKRHIRARMAECGGELDAFMDWLREIIEVINRTPFLRGSNAQGWMVTFDWVTKCEANGVKILEGQYDQNYEGMHEARHGQAGQPGQPGQPPEGSKPSGGSLAKRPDAELRRLSRAGNRDAERALRERGNRRTDGAARDQALASMALHMKRHATAPTTT